MTEKEENKSSGENEKKAENKGAGENHPDGDLKETAEEQAFPIVGLGASAGGLDALKAFFSNVSEDSGMAYIVVSHMKPDQPSMLPELLQKATKIPVSTARDDCNIEPGHVYVIPPSKNITISNGCIRLTRQKENVSRLPIDLFFRSLAEDRGNMAAAIILSGTGTDGSIGIKEIKNRVALVLAQSEETAQYDGMPRSAVSTGIVDAVLSPEEMPKTLDRVFGKHASVSAKKSLADGEDTQNWLKKIFHVVQNEIGHDFSFYKTNTLLRRISRRMTLNQIEEWEKYYRLLKENPVETRALFQEMLIGATNFFRDPEAFEILKNTVLPQYLEAMKTDEVFRAWVPGCSTGEDVYSMAMILKESLEEKRNRIGIQLFGTDVDGRAIEKAREGAYPASIAADVKDKRLERFFYKEGEFYRIRKEIRDCAVFSVHDVLKDPPFSRLHLLCCRNLLIYLNSQAQKKLLPLFHYTLKPDGILVLGPSESIGTYWELFETVNKKWKIFRRQEVPRSRSVLVDFPSGPLKEMGQPGSDRCNDAKKDDLGQLTRDALL